MQNLPSATKRAATAWLAVLCACGAGAANAGGDASASGSPDVAASEDGATFDATAAQGEAGAAGDAGEAGEASNDASNEVNPVSLCPVDTMDLIYAGPLPPNPYGPLPQAPPCIAARHDVIIVLGCPNNADGTPSTCQTKRADLALAWMTAGLATRFITSGAAAHNQYVEADTLRDLLVARGVPQGAIWTDTQAMHTDENVYFSSLIMRAHGWTDAVVVTDDPGQLLFTGLCDSNCCVDLGRMTVLQFDVGGAVQKQGHYVLFPWAQPVSAAECAQIEQPAKAMCTNLASRTACAGHVIVDAGGQ